MSGRPADRWQKFTFRTAPGWIWALAPLALVGLIGWVVIVIVRYTVTRTAKGVLPLHHSRRAQLLWLRWGSAGAILLGPAIFIAGLIANNGWIVLVGGLLFVVAVLFAAFALRWFGPRAKVVEIPGYPMFLLELRNVHPAFVQALAEIQAGRLATPYQPLPYYQPPPQQAPPYYSGPR